MAANLWSVLIGGKPVAKGDLAAWHWKGCDLKSRLDEFSSSAVNWMTILWPMAAAACLTMGLIHLRTGLRREPATAYLLFSVNAFAAAAFAFIELALARADSVTHYLALLRWLDLESGVLLVSLTAFVWAFFGTGRKWLALLGCGVLCVSLIADLLPEPKLIFREVTAIETIPIFGGAIFTVAKGAWSPWNAVYSLGAFLILLFVMDASATLWRRGTRRRAVVVGGAITFFMLVAGAEAMLVEAGILRMPYLVSLVYIVVVVAMGQELSNELLNAAQLARDLRDSEERMTVAAEAAGVGVWMWDFTSNEIWRSEKWPRLFGFSSGDEVSIGEITRRIHPDDRRIVERATRRALKERGDYVGEYRVILPDGSLRWIAGRGRLLLDKHGKPARMLGASIDITERRRAEEALRESEARFRSVANTAPVMIWMSGTDKLCNFFNQVWLDFTGRGLEEELGNGWVEGIHPVDKLACVKNYGESFDARRPFALEYRLRRHDGEYRWISDTGVPRYDADQKFLGYIGSCVDITASKEAEAELQLQRAEVAHVGRVAVMGELASALAHELNQPLGAILRNAEAAEVFLRSPAPDLEELRAILTDIRRDDERAGSVIDRMRELLKHREFQSAAIDLNDLVAEVASLVRLDAQTRQVVLVVEPGPVPPPVLGDRIQLQQVLLNLFLNAMDAMANCPLSARRVIVSVNTLEGDVEVAVRDSGHGISAESLKRIFEPFFTTKENGLGIGLAISRTITTAHGGRILAENNPDGGATFRLRLPAAGGKEKSNQ